VNELESPYITVQLEATDTQQGFSCGKRSLDDYFAEEEGWPRRMFLPIGTARAAFAEA
jgi:hypothetical protein